MNREIKFRALHEGVWYYQTLEEIITITLAAFRNGKHKTQFTGLKDKNGNEIYEGDIVRMFTHFNHRVDFYRGAFGYWHNSVDKYFISFDSNTNFEWENNQSDRLEIIGNIYQHPELLK